MTDFEEYKVGNDPLTAFSAIAVHDKYDNIIGTFVLQLDPQPFVEALGEDTGMGIDREAFILGSDQTIWFSVGVDADAPESNNTEYFQGTELGMHPTSGNRGVDIIDHPGTGEVVIAAYGCDGARLLDCALDQPTLARFTTRLAAFCENR